MRDPALSPAGVFPSTEIRFSSLPDPEPSQVMRDCVTSFRSVAAAMVDLVKNGWMSRSNQS
jgi:hypothetical protein